MTRRQVFIMASLLVKGKCVINETTSVKVYQSDVQISVNSSLLFQVRLLDTHIKPWGILENVKQSRIYLTKVGLWRMDNNYFVHISQYSFSPVYWHLDYIHAVVI